MTPADRASLATSLRNVALRLERGDADRVLAEAEIDEYGEPVRLAIMLLRELAWEIEGGSPKVKRRPYGDRRFVGECDEEPSQALAEDYRDPDRQGQDRPLISEDGQPALPRVGLPRSISDKALLQYVKDHPKLGRPRIYKALRDADYGVTTRRVQNAIEARDFGKGRLKGGRPLQRDYRR